MPCVCGATPYGHCVYCRRPIVPSKRSYGPIKFDDRAVIVLVGAPGSGKTTLGCCLLQQLGGFVLGNEMASYDVWGLPAPIQRLPPSGNVLIDSLETIKMPGLLRRRAGITIGIARLNAQGGLFGGLADLYDCDALIVLDQPTGLLELHKSRYQGDAGRKIRYKVEYPNFHIDSDFTADNPESLDSDDEDDTK